MKIATATIIQWNLKSPLSAQIYTICTNIHYLHKSPLSAQISTICTNLHYLHKSPLSAQIYTICTNLHYLHTSALSAQIYTISILSAQIATICTNLHYLHKSTLSAQIYTIYTHLHYLHKYTLYLYYLHKYLCSKIGVSLIFLVVKVPSNFYLFDFQILYLRDIILIFSFTYNHGTSFGQIDALHFVLFKLKKIYSHTYSLDIIY